MARGRTVDVGIRISAIDATRRAVQSARRSFAQLRSDFSSVRPGRMSSNIRSSMRDIRSEIRKTSGVTRGWYAAMWRGAEVTGRQSLPRLQKEIKKTSQVARQSSRGFVDGFGDINRVMSSSLLTMGLFSVGVVSLGKKLLQSTLDMDQYIRGFKVLDGSLQNAKATMADIIEVSKLPGIQIPAAARGYMNLRAVGVSGGFAIQVLEEFSNAVAIAGGRSIDLRESVRQLSQTLSINKIDMENWRVMLERIPTMRIAVQKAFGPKSIHTEHLAKVMEKEGLTAEQTWRQILQQMMYTERADPDTITNAVERLQNTLWHMAANIGTIYAPAVQSILKTLNNLAESFNNLSKPTREFIAGIFNTFGGLIAMGAAVWGVIRIFKGITGAVTAARNAVANFRDMEIYREGTRRGKRAKERWGAMPDITRRELMPFGEHRRRSGIRARMDPDNVTYKEELRGRYADAEDVAQTSKREFEHYVSTLDQQKTDQERLIREQEKKQLRHDILEARVERDRLEATRSYEKELAKISTEIEQEHLKIDRHQENMNETELKSLEKQRAGLKSLVKQRQQLIDSFPQVIQDVEQHSRKFQRRLANEQLARETYTDERGMTRFRHAERESEAQRRTQQGRDMMAKDLVNMRKDVRQTERLRDKALANLRSINHFAIWTEVAYGGLISALLAGAGFAISQLIAHFQELGESISRFDKYMNEHATHIVKWENQYKEWRNAIRDLQNGYEGLSKAMRTAFEAELKGLEYIERAGGKLSEDQLKHREWLTGVLETGRKPLTKYEIEYLEKQIRQGKTELLDSERVSEAEKIFGRELEKVLDERKHIRGTQKLLDLLPESDLENLLKIRRFHRRTIDEVSKLPDEQTKGMPWLDKLLKQGELGVANYFDRTRMSQELYRQYREISEPVESTTRFRSVIATPPRLEKALDNIIQERDLTERLNEFRELVRWAQNWRDEDVGKILPDFDFSDIENWEVGISGARKELARLREELLAFSIPMQNYQKTRMSYLQSIISLEDTATKQAERLNAERRKAQDRYDLNAFMLRHQGVIQDIISRREDEKILMTLRREMGEEALPTSELDEINRILQVVGGDKAIKSIIDRITQASVHADKVALDAVKEKYQDTLDTFLKDFEKLQQDWLQGAQRGMQDTTFERIAGRGALGGQIQSLRQYIATLRQLRDSETDVLRSDEYTRAIRLANSQLQTLVEQRGVDIRKSMDIWSLDPEGNILGVSPEQLDRVMAKLADQTSTYGIEVRNIMKLWERVFGLTRDLGEDSLMLSTEDMREIQKIMGQLVEYTIEWESHIGNVEQRIHRLTGELIAAPKGMRGVIRDRMGFIGSLQGPDREKFDALLDKYKKTLSEIAKLEQVQAGGHGNLITRLQHGLENYEAWEDWPLAKTDSEALLSELEKMTKAAEDGKIGELRKNLVGLRKDIDNLLGDENQERRLKYLTDIRLRLNDLVTGVPPAVKLRDLREDLERIERTEAEPGKEAQRLQSIQNLQTQIREQETHVKVMEWLNREMRKELPLLKEQADLLKLSAEEQDAFNKLQKQAIQNYRDLYDAKQRDAIQSAIVRELSRGAETTEQSKAIERIRRISGRATSSQFATPEERERMLLSGTLGNSRLTGRVTSGNYNSFMRTSRRALNELDLLESYYGEYFRPDPGGADAFRQRVVDTIRKETGNTVDPQWLDTFMNQVDQARQTAGADVMREISQARDSILRSREAASNMGRMFVDDLGEAIKKQGSKIYDQVWDSLWGAWVDSPRMDKRREEDRLLSKKRQIEDIREMRREREISARDARERIKDIEKNYLKDSLREEEDALIKRERMWEDFFQSLIKGFADVVKETLKARAGLTAGNWIGDLLGWDQLPGQGQGIKPQHSFYFQTGETLKNSLIQEFGSEAAGNIYNFLKGGKQPGGAGMKEGSITSYFIDPAYGKTAASAGKTALSKVGGLGPALGWAAIAHNAWDALSQWHGQGGLSALPGDLKRLFTLSFDNPANDLAARNTGHSRANRIAKMLGMNTPKDLIQNYETAMLDGFSSMQVANSQVPEGGGDVKAAIDSQTSQIVEAIANAGGDVTVVLPGNFVRDLTHDQQSKIRKGIVKGFN